SGDLHGTDGPLKVSDPRHKHPLSVAFVKAAQEIGIPYNDDFNGPRQAGVGFYQTTTFQGKRGSAAATYLKSVRGDPRLKVMTNAHVLDIVLENGAAVGVRARMRNNKPVEFRSNHEVVLSAGALSSPKILMLSGIGSAQDLAEVGIRVLRDLPGVGRNFQDHMTASVYGQTKDKISLLGADKGLAAAQHGLQYIAFRAGLLTSNVIESGGFVDTTGGCRPDIQIHVTPTLVGDIDRMPPEGHGVTLNPCYLRPKSRGIVKLRSRDPDDPLLFHARFFSHPDDMATLVRGVKLCRKILRAPSLARLIEREIMPAEAEDISDAAIEEHIRKITKTVFHPSGTCRLGTHEGAVVDPQLRVRGVDRLRVADASIMPTLVSGNTNAPSIMIGERCADFILGRAAAQR
ncbi:MAG: GMC oxidoreductase, partial [Tardiphaga sp.]